LSSSLAHEISQPLAAILHNTEAAEILLRGANPDLTELRAIVADIQRDDARAGEVIAGLRALFTRREMEFTSLSVETLVQGCAHRHSGRAKARHGARPRRAAGIAGDLRGQLGTGHRR
jgi:two-component system sensor kinase FixL